MRILEPFYHGNQMSAVARALDTNLSHGFGKFSREMGYMWQGMGLMPKDSKSPEDAPDEPIYGDVSVTAAAEPYLRRKGEGTKTNLTSTRKTKQVKNRTYGTVGQV